MRALVIAGVLLALLIPVGVTARDGFSDPVPVPEFDDPPAPSLEPPALSEEEQRVRAILDRYFAEKEAKKKAEEDAAREAGYVIGSDPKMDGSWNNGFEAITQHKDFRVHIGGRSQLDTSWYAADTTVNQNINRPYADGIDVRRARLRIDGTMYEQIDWAVEYDFVQGFRVQNQPANATTPSFSDVTLTAPTDLWWTFKELPVIGNVRLGIHKEPIGFEHLVSSRFLPFIERSYNQDTFYGGLFNGFLPGISAFDNYGEDDLGYWHLGVWKPGNQGFGFNTGNGDYSVCGRLTRLLWYECEGASLLHVGASARQATAVRQNSNAFPGRTQTFRTRDAIRSGLASNWPTPAAITMFGDDMQWLNGELVAVHGPWTFQAEYLISGLQDARANFTDPLGHTVTYHGGYVQLLCFLTGEHDNYNKKTAVFDRVKPLENFFLVDADGACGYGSGAWQVGVRYDYLDLDDDGFNGGLLHNLTAGVNWFLNPNMKLQGNYFATHRDVSLAPGVGDGWIHGWGVRVAHDF